MRNTFFGAYGFWHCGEGFQAVLIMWYMVFGPHLLWGNISDRFPVSPLRPLGIGRKPVDTPHIVRFEEFAMIGTYDERVGVLIMDAAQIQMILGLAGSAVGLTGQAAATAETVKKLFGGDVKGDPSEAQQLLNNLASQMTAVNMLNVDLSRQLKELANEIDRQNKFEEKKAKYRLIETKSGDVVYQLTANAAGDDPMHYVCPICLEKEGIFAFVTGNRSSSHKHCQACNHGFQFEELRMPTRRANSWTA